MRDKAGGACAPPKAKRYLHTAVRTIRHVRWAILSPHMTIEAGTRLGPYEIIAPLGAGGMGEVWKGRDTRLDRDVAIKILPPGFAQNEQFRARFEREAKTISSLNHPNICTLFDVGHEGDTHFLVMELIEGDSLADRLTKGPLPLDQVLKVGAQVADALDRAHKQGIVHRDLKPGNVMLTKTGAKLLDFGLARTAADTSPIQGLTEMPTQAKPLTAEGTILGTFQYMAPEQLEGAEADARTDIFALGAMIYEMATGARAFVGDSKPSLIAAIMSSQPQPISSVMQVTPPALDHVVKKCLEKDADDRWQSAHDIASELRWVAEGSGAVMAPDVPVRRSKRLAATLVVALIAAVLGASGMWLIQNARAEPKEIVNTSVVPPTGGGFAFLGDFAGIPTISPDGRSVAVVAAGATGAAGLWLRDLDNPVPRFLPGTEGAFGHFWSPDGQSLGFFKNQKLWRVEISGGTPRPLADAPLGKGGAWTADGRIIFSPGSLDALQVVDVTGGSVRPFSVVDRTIHSTHRLPFVLEDGSVLYFAASHDDATGANRGIWMASPDGAESRRVMVSDSQAVVAGGRLLTIVDGELFAFEFDAASATVRQPGTRLGLDVQFDATTWKGGFDARGDLLAYVPPSESAGSNIHWYDREGKRGETDLPPGNYLGVRISPDGRLVALEVEYGKPVSDLWIYDLQRQVRRRLTIEENDEADAVWSPDGRLIYFGSAPSRPAPGEVLQFSIRSRPTSGVGGETTVYESTVPIYPTDVSPDGRYLLVAFVDVGGSSQPGEEPGQQTTANVGAGRIAFGNRMTRSQPLLTNVQARAATGEYGISMGVIRLDEPTEEPVVLIDPEANVISALFSPDGKWIAFSSDVTGNAEVYVTPFDPESGGGSSPREGRWPVSTDGGSIPKWSADGKELFFIKEDGRMAVAPISVVDDGLVVGRVEDLFGASFRMERGVYDVAADGRFLAIALSATGNEPFSLVSGWQGLLR